MESAQNNYLQSVKKELAAYKLLAEKALEQLPRNEALYWEPNDTSNSIATIIKHLHGNMQSRFTNFLTTDGEKEWRNRDAEFESNPTTKENLIHLWEAGWQCVFNAINNLSAADLDKTVYIRNQAHTVTEAINRQLAHYAYHIGQLIFIAKMISSESWQSLSIPKGKSQHYNATMFTNNNALNKDAK